MRAPLGPSVDRFDLAYALLADIACGIFLHYESLCEIKSHKKDYILGCGGGFQSRLLGQWIADLAHKDIILRRNYHQASVQGCAAILNETLRHHAPAPDDFTVLHPEPDTAIREYYERWIDYRNLSNPL